MTVRTGADGRQLAEAELRAAIARRELVAGQRLIEDELAERLGVTRSSLRQAIDALVGEGLVERIKNRGARVRELSIADAVEITECRAVLEGLLARKAAERAHKPDIAELCQTLDAMREALSAGDFLKYSEHITALYEQVHSIANHANALALVGRLQAQLVRQQFQLSLVPGRAQQSMNELAKVIEAISDGHPHDAEEFMREHLQGVAGILASEEDRTVLAF